jgi:hypothetical protein
MSRWLPDVLRGNRGRPGISSFTDLNAYLSGVWSPLGYYLDEVHGDDSNAGTSWAQAFKSSDALTERLCLTRPIGHSMTVHVAPGSYGSLRADVTQTALGIPFDIVGYPSYSPLGLLSSYSDRVLATNISPLVSIVGMPDASSLSGSRIEVVDGAVATLGAIAWGVKANAHSLGANVLRTCRFAMAGVGNFTPITVSPVPGVSLSTVALPEFDSIDVRISSPLPDVGTDYQINRSGRISDVSVGSLAVFSNGRFNVDRSEIGYWSTQLRTAYIQVYLSRCSLRGLGTSTTVVNGYFLTGTIGRVGSPLRSVGAPLNSVTLSGDANLYDCIVQGVSVFPRNNGTTGGLTLCGIFDTPSNAAVVISKSSPGVTRVGQCYGSGNAVAGIDIGNGCSVVSSTTGGNSIVGAGGAIRLSGPPALTLATHDQWLDGAQAGLATLVAGSTVVAGVSTIVVPRVLSTQVLQVSRRTALGVVGDLTINWVDDTHIRVDSNSAADTSVVSWSILPAGAAANYIKAF